MSDDRWRDNYDAWKLRSPYDDEPEQDCDHAEYEVDWEGRATCDYCRADWWLTADELRSHDEAQARWMAEYDRMQRREHSWFWRAVDWLQAQIRRAVPRKRARALNADDDVPF